MMAKMTGAGPYAGVLWSAMGVYALLLLFTGVAAFALMLRQKRPVGAALALASALLSYGAFQCLGETEQGTAAALTVGRFAGSLPPWLLLLACAALTAGEAGLFYNITAHRKNRITLMSIKEATDGLPMGILCYMPSGRILLVNGAMERFCERLTGDMLIDGLAFAEKLYGGRFRPGCRTIDGKGTLVIGLSDGTVWTVAEEVMAYEKIEIQAIMVSDITDAYCKTLELRQMQEQVLKLNAKLTETNREIVSLTVEREILAAKVKIHDELGQNLLAIKRMILGGGETESEKAEMMKRLHENIDFLKGEADTVPDEYELMIDTARQLGVEVVVSGPLPQVEPLKHIVATGIHECFTNTLRHAHGDKLYVHVTEEAGRIVVVFTCNGDQPKEKIEEKGGLGLLRTLTVQAGGQMTVRTEPAFSITIKLPKEE